MDSQARAEMPPRMRQLRDLQEMAATREREALDLSAVVGLAMRAARRSMRLSQREFARAHGWSTAQQARVETRATDLGLGQVRWMLSATEFVMCMVGSGLVARVETAETAAEWVVTRSTQLGVSTRELAATAETSQSVVTRLRSPRSIDRVTLARMARVVEALGGQIRIAWDGPIDPVLVDGSHWPVAAVLPRVRGGQRRLAAHGWIRAMEHLGGPWWYAERHADRYDFEGPPQWTASAPHSARWPQAASSNSLAPVVAPELVPDVVRLIDRQPMSE